MFRLLLLAAITAAQSTTWDVGVPRGTPVVGDYTGAYRPQIHYSPPTEFMNDPNGCFLDENGTYHMYYQYNPTDTVAGNQHWGHATSRDLYHWDNQPISIFPDNSSSQIFSGSVVIDSNNTSGFFPNQTNGVVAIYTLNTAAYQVQEIAYSVDGGYTFTKYSGNPVITANYSTTQFRDPKVIRYGDHWAMVVAYSQDFTIGIFTSPDLITWTHASNFSHAGLLGLQYECPNLVSMPMENSSESVWVLAISINPGAPLGGSITQYFPGTFDGYTFTAVDAAARIANFGKDNYAGQWFYNTPQGEDAVFIGWASNWQYAQVVPTGEQEGWRSAMSLPRKTRLANVTRIGYDLISTPYDLPAVYDEKLASNANLGNGSVMVDYSTLESGAVYFQANISGINTTTAAGTLNFTFSSSVSSERVSGGFFLASQDFFVDRGMTKGFDNPFFTDKVSANHRIKEDGTFMLEGIVDRSILEVFLDDGVRSATTTFFPTMPLDTLAVRAGGLTDGIEVSVEIWGLKSAWAEMASEGLVYGNVTSNTTQAMRRSGIAGLDFGR